MLVLKLAYENNIDIAMEILNFKDILEKKNIKLGLVEVSEGNINILKILTMEDCSEEEKLSIKKYVSNILYKYIIKEYKKNELFDYITNNYFFLRQQEILEIENTIMKVLLLDEKPAMDIFVYCYKKINNILDNIINCILENDEININGFLTFRMKELRCDIEKIVDKIIERYIIEKEYEEFIELLKYFISIQDSKIDTINIYIKPQNLYEVRDENYNDIFNKLIDDISDSEINMLEANMEDILISGLITNSPKKIIIHGKDNCNNKEFLNTLCLVFEERVSFCDDCKYCNSSKNNIKIHI